MSAEIIKLLRKTPIFSTLDSSSLKKITGFFKERTFSADEVLYKEGTLGDTLYIIKEGAIKITRSAKEGEEETSRSLRREGDIFGESGFIDETPRPATAQATKSTRVLELCRSDFLTILNNNPLVAYQIVKVLSARLKHADLRAIEELKEKNERLQQTLKELQGQHGGAEGKDWSEQPPVSTQKEESLSHLLLSYVPYPVVFADKHDRIRFFNKAAEKEFGYKSEEIMGTPMGALWDGTAWAELGPAVEQELNTGGGWEGEMLVKRENGTVVCSTVMVTQVLDDQGESQGRLYVSRSASPSSSPEASRESLDLKDFFQQELPLVKTHDKFRDITFATNFEESMPKVSANRRQLQQMLCAMLDNAASALQPISGRTKTITIEACSVNEKRSVQIMISDNGAGISSGNLPKVFREPFTTKTDAAGLGLLSVDRIVKDHGGTIKVHSDEGAYTLFVIKLPASQEKQARAAQAEPALQSVN